MKVLIMSKASFNKFLISYNITDENVEQQDMVFISINDPIPFDSTKIGTRVQYNSYFEHEHSNVLIMRFGDYSESISTKLKLEGSKDVFDEEDAKNIKNFILRNSKKNLAVIHCSAGVSRSGAVGTFIHDLFKEEDWSSFKRRNPKIVPNLHIMKLLNNQMNNE